jgi:flagellar FliJ protein
MQTVLDYRGILEDQARQHLAEATRREKELLDALARERQAQKDLYEDFEQRQKTGMPPDELLLYRRHLGERKTKLARMVKEWEVARAGVEEKREALCEASREKKLLEKVKERFMAEEQREQLRRENLFLDEIAVQGNSRGKE